MHVINFWGDGDYVEYQMLGPSYSYWMIPGSWLEDTPW